LGLSAKGIAVKLKNILLCTICSVGIYCLTEVNCSAQRAIWSQPGQKPARWLGSGWSAGYHWRNPGHDSSYYNPYSPHNSLRISDSWQSMYDGGSLYKADNQYQNPALFESSKSSFDQQSTSRRNAAGTSRDSNQLLQRPGEPKPLQNGSSQDIDSRKPAQTDRQKQLNPGAPIDRRKSTEDEWPFPID
jgi:hypothetical protein